MYRWVDEPRLRARRSPSMRDLYWAAGFLEGEGNFQRHRRSGVVGGTNTDMEPIGRLRLMFGGSVLVREPQTNGSVVGRLPIYHWHASGPRAAGIMLTLYCLLSQKRQAEIRHALLMEGQNGV